MPSVVVRTEEGLGWREVKTGGCGHKPRDAGHWRPEEMGRTTPAGGGSAVLRTLGPGLGPQAVGEGASGPSCGASLQQPQEVWQGAAPEA